jgi:formaldehyde-activating enzyme involved in methanogenesis
MKSILYLVKKWWIVAAVFVGIRSKDDLKLISKNNDSSKQMAKEVLLDEYEINTYHS